MLLAPPIGEGAREQSTSNGGSKDGELIHQPHIVENTTTQIYCYRSCILRLELFNLDNRNLHAILWILTLPLISNLTVSSIALSDDGEACLEIPNMWNLPKEEDQGTETHPLKVGHSVHIHRT
jgi:hypothetical protein